MSARIVIRVISTLLFLVCFQSDLFAQRQRLFARVDRTLVELDTEPARLGTVLRRWALPLQPAEFASGFVPLSGGRYLAFSNLSKLTLLDLVTGATFSLDVPGGILAVDVEGQEVTLISRDFETGRYTLHVVNSTFTVRQVPLPSPSGTCHYPIAYAQGARLLMILSNDCGLVRRRQWINVVNLADGTIREKAFEVPVGYSQSFATNETGTRLWVADIFAGYGVFDVASGTLLAFNGVVRPELRSWPTLIVDSPSNVVLTVTADGLVALQADTLQPVASADAPKYRPNDRQWPPGYVSTFGYQILMDPNAAAIFVFEHSGMVYGDHGAPLCLQSALVALDPRTGGRLATRNLTNATGAPECGVFAAMMVAPAAPSAFSASVVGHRVTLTWDRPPQATHYELEAGSARGLRNLAKLTVGSTSYTADNVPSGTYYVRVRALNHAGKGAYTGDVKVVVP